MYEVILVDNGSSDRSPEIASRLFGGNKNFKIIRSATNLGFAGGNNLGAKAATGNILVFLNVDTEVSTHWLQGFVSGFSASTNIGVLQAKLLLLSDRQSFDSAGDLVDFFGFGTCLGNDWKERDVGQYDSAREVFSARGAALAIKQELFWKIGGFDESFFLDSEDIDLCWRSWLADYRVMYEPKSVVYHAASSRDLLFRSITRSHHPVKNWFAMMIKNYGLWNQLKYTAPALLLFTPLYGLVGIRRRTPKLIELQMKGISWVFLNLRKIMKKRVEVQNRIRVVSDSVVQSHMVKTTVTRRLQLYYLAWRIGNPRASYWYIHPLLDEIGKYKVANARVENQLSEVTKVNSCSKSH